MNLEGVRKLVAEAAGTAMLVFFAVGVATLSFGFGFTGGSTSAGVVATALAFGLVLLVLAYALGPISGCHVNPAVTMGFLAAKRIRLREAVSYWIAQVVGAIVGALVLWGVVHSGTRYHDSVGLGANGFGKQSMIGLSAGGAILVEVVMTFLFVFTVLSVTRKAASPLMAGLAIGLALTVVHLFGIPMTGTSVNPARSIGPALFVGGVALSQLWVFIVAPLIGGALAAFAHEYLFPSAEDAPPAETVVPEPRVAAKVTTAAAEAG
jgi:aquaporin Z